MNSKYLLFLGIVLLIIGIILRYFTSSPATGLTLIITGVILKFAYILLAFVKGEYKPGKEVYFLVTGLIILFLGIWYKANINASSGLAIIATGVSLKIIFIVLFIRKKKSVINK